MSPPGLNPRRLVRLMENAIRRCDLRLHEFTVLTEAATGTYMVTPLLAAMAGSPQVFAVTRDTRYGTAASVRAGTEALAALAGVADRIQVLPATTEGALRAADIITNSGHLRPLDAATVGRMKIGAVIPLMYEAWECRPEDVDLAACRTHGIAVAGTNECHTAVGVFSYLGIMAVKLLLDAGIPVYGSRVLVLSDNPFAPFLVDGLRGAGAEVVCAAATPESGEEFDAVLVALRPGPSVSLSWTARMPGAVVAQFWGDIERDELVRLGVPLWPPSAPAPGHMGILPSGVGPDPVVRLQSGGLKVGQMLAEAMRCHPAAGPRGAIEAAVASGFGQAVKGFYD